MLNVQCIYVYLLQHLLVAPSTLIHPKCFDWEVEFVIGVVYHAGEELA